LYVYFRVGMFSLLSSRAFLSLLALTKPSPTFVLIRLFWRHFIAVYIPSGM
jgi:hypothetical protein